jgi:hypothetical protein
MENKMNALDRILDTAYAKYSRTNGDLRVFDFPCKAIAKSYQSKSNKGQGIKHNLLPGELDQEIRLKLLEVLEAYEPGKGPFGLLFQLSVRRMLFDLQRKNQRKKRQATLELTEITHVHAPSFEAQILQEVDIKLFLNQLTPDEQMLAQNIMQGTAPYSDELRKSLSHRKVKALMASIREKGRELLVISS